MKGWYWISWLLFYGFCSVLAWRFSNENIVVGLVVFAILTFPISLWARAKSKKTDPTEGTLK
jgi:hypothetical protein